jgi:uncharacterized protein (DUF362 family)
MTDGQRRKRRREQRAELSRRALLKQAGATFSTLAFGVGCGGDDGGGESEAGAGGEGICGSAAGTTPSGGTGAGTTGGSAAGTTGGSAGTGTGGMAQAGTGGMAPSDSGVTSDSAVTEDAGSGRTTVAIVHRDNLDDAVARAVELAGGLEAIQPGQSVFIKLNAVSDRAIGTPGIRTSNEMLAAVIKLVKTRDPGRIIVGDRSARQFPDTMEVFRNAGIEEAALAAGADEVYAAPTPEGDPDAWMLLQPESFETSWSAAGGILCMRRILEADHLINVPTCKNHRYALFSMSMKNFIGAIGDSSRDPLHFGDSIAGSFGPIGRDIAILNVPFRPLLNILDASVALINGGPQGDSADAVRATPGLVLASRDRVALDAAGISLIKLELSRTDVPQPDASHTTLMSTNAWSFPQIVEGGMRGLGATSAADVDLAFDDVADQAALETLFRA